jgi:predicted AAA+ superfamily ATPase
VIDRARHRQRLLELLAHHPVVAILGPRQVGKTTLARDVMAHWSGAAVRFDLEDPDDVARLAEPKLAIGELDGLVVIDEVQRRPELFPVLRVLVDRPRSSARFLILGSASPELLRQSSESLAGRIFHHTLEGFDIAEVGVDARDELWLRGGFPRSFLAPTIRVSAEWRREFIRTFLERDLPQLGVQVPAETLHRFWRMLAHYHAQVWNGAELARSFGVAATTVRRYLDLLAGALVIRILAPWHENIAKRQVKAPKVLVADSGLLHSLLGIATRDELEGHPKIGASWEGFAIREIIAHLGAEPSECFFWRTHAGAELDLLVVRGGRRFGFEIKRTTAPSVTASMRSAREALRLGEVHIVHAGNGSFPLAEGFQAVALEELPERIERLA